MDEEDLAYEVPMSSQDVPVVEGRQQAEKLLQTAAKSSRVRGLCGRQGLWRCPGSGGEAAGGQAAPDHGNVERSRTSVR